jgi:hypothetical protein
VLHPYVRHCGRVVVVVVVVDVGVVVEVVFMVVTVDALVEVAAEAAAVAAAVIAAEIVVALFPGVVGARLKLLDAEANAVPVTTFCAAKGAVVEFDVDKIATCWPPDELIKFDELMLLLL